jgi:hypothetical protein
MSLDKSVLKTAIKNMILNGYTDIPSAAAAWANAYDSYANGSISYAQDQSADRPTVVNKPAMQAGLVSAFGTGAPVAAANAIEAACISYWTGATFGVLHPPILLDPLAISDVLALVSNPGSGLSVSLQSIFSTLSADADAKADDIATAFDTYTKTIQVFVNYLKTNPTPPPPIIPATITLSVS